MAKITLKDLSIVFPVMGQNRTLRRELFTRRTGGLLNRDRDKRTVTVTALNEINLTIEDGDRLGLIGHNGSGKTTLLQVIAGVYPPVNGHISVEGKISALFNPALGMDMDETGIDNIRSVGLYLGLSPAEIEKKIDGIVEFSELGEFIALPVRTYSSGMLTRLSFSLVTSIEPDILLVDEDIGTGDARFEKRAKQRINEFLGRSSIVVLASHSEQMIRDICNKAVLLEAGNISATGSVDEMFDEYKRLNDQVAP